MNKVNNDEIPHLNILNQYIKDLSYENLQKNVGQNQYKRKRYINRYKSNLQTLMKIILKC